MKIRICTKALNKTLRFPTRLLFNRTTPFLLDFGLHIAKRHTNDVPNISRAAVKVFCKEVRRVKKHRRSFDLIHVQTADGTEVEIIL